MLEKVKLAIFLVIYSFLVLVGSELMLTLTAGLFLVMIMKKDFTFLRRYSLVSLFGPMPYLLVVLTNLTLNGLPVGVEAYYLTYNAVVALAIMTFSLTLFESAGVSKVDKVTPS